MSFCSNETEDYWFGLYKRTATVNSTTLWLDASASTYRWWSPAQPDDIVRCIGYTPTGFDDRHCSEQLLFMCKMLASKQQVCSQWIAAYGTHAGGGRRVGRVVSGIGDSACPCACPHSKGKTTRAVNNKLGAHILLGRTSACIDPEVKWSNFHTVTTPSQMHGY